MEFKELLAKRRSVRKFATDRPVPADVVDRLLAAALAAPSSRNSRSTRLLVVDDPAAVARMADMRDYGSGFLKGTPLAIVVLGDTQRSDLWEVNAAIAATLLQLAAVDEGLASCWVQIAGRPRREEAPDGNGPRACGLLPISEVCRPLCDVALELLRLRPASTRRGRRHGAHRPHALRATKKNGRGSPAVFCFRALRAACTAGRSGSDPALRLRHTWFDLLNTS